ncbi:hypothetical protein BJX66DRAFT_314942 [Aspergillus keveii]|uniref:Uncharacterized protein n=1 Tax=Aspergillus keveii TaxID=714993 RepID=A0ABR4FQA4_9EURO
MEPPVDYSLFPTTSVQGYLQDNDLLPPGHQERTISYPSLRFPFPSDNNLGDATAPVAATCSNLPNLAALSKPMRSTNMYTVPDAPLLLPVNYPTSSSTAIDVIQGSDRHRHNESTTTYHDPRILPPSILARHTSGANWMVVEAKPTFAVKEILFGTYGLFISQRMHTLALIQTVTRPLGGRTT